MTTGITKECQELLKPLNNNDDVISHILDETKKKHTLKIETFISLRLKPKPTRMPDSVYKYLINLIVMEYFNNNYTTNDK